MTDKAAAYLQQENDVLHARVRKLEIALASEREACAKVAEEYKEQFATLSINDDKDAGFDAGVRCASHNIATLIRGRGET